MPPSFFLFLFLFLFFLPPIASLSSRRNPLFPFRYRAPRSYPCGTFCTFETCNNNGTIFPLDPAPFTLLSAPETAQFPFICSQRVSSSLSTPVSRITMSGEALVYTNAARGSYVELSQWRPRGLRAPFPADALAFFPIPQYGVSGLGARPLSAPQFALLHDRCVVLPVKQYVAGGDDNRPASAAQTQQKRRQKQQQQQQGLVTTDWAREDCVAFRLTAPQLHVHLLWDTDDDFDLLVQEPDGAVIDFLNLKSKTGKLNKDNGVGKCGLGVKGGRENVVYFPSGKVPRGTFLVEVWHAQLCKERRVARWEVRVINFGKVVASWKGSASLEGEYGLVAEHSFEYRG